MEKRRGVVVVGILALQGNFETHKECFLKLQKPEINVIEVRTAEVLETCDALVIPGGESTTMRILANVDDGKMMKTLRHFVLDKKKAVWGTCAGCILLSENINNIHNSDNGNDDENDADVYGSPFGGVRVKTCRNYFGRQIDSFETPLIPMGRLQNFGVGVFTAVCIRAPAILKSLSEEVEILAKIIVEGKEVIAAAADGTNFVTIFHPELTDNLLLHQFFLENFVLKLNREMATEEAETTTVMVERREIH